MRIVHLLASVDGDARRAGDVSACVEQCTALVRHGHEVRILLAWRGRRTPPAALGGLPVTGVRVGDPDGRAVTSSGARDLLGRLRREGRGHDLVHVHGVEDPLSAAAARILRRAGVPYVVEPGNRPLPAPGRRHRLGADPLIALLRGARYWLAASPDQAAGLRALAGDGVPVGVHPWGVLPRDVLHVPRPPRDTPADRIDVLVLGPLGPDRPVLAVARAAALLVEEGAAVEVCVAGPDAGARHELLAFVGSRPHLADRLRYEGRLGYEAARERLLAADAAVVTAPDDACPVGLPEALAAGLPVLYVGAGHPFDRAAASLAVRRCDPAPEAVLAALRLLVSDAAGPRPERARRAAAALDAVRPVDAAVEERLSVYAEAVRGRGSADHRVPEPR